MPMPNAYVRFNSARNIALIWRSFPGPVWPTCIFATVLGQNGRGQNGTDKMAPNNHQLIKLSSFHWKYDFLH